MNINKPKTYSIIFDYIRVFAMLGVLAVHLSQLFPVPALLKSVLGMGAYCVQVFFVISAYLACSYFYKPEASTIDYYKKRAIRILPTYYAAITAAIIYVTIFTNGYPEDTYRLGWLRYFLALNTLLPSDSYWHWNNAFAFWTMTDFIFFYAIIPLLIKVVHSFNRSLIFFMICYAVALCATHKADAFLPKDFCSEPLYFIHQSPLVQMQHFALGVMTFFAAKNEKKSFACILLILLAALPAHLCPSPLKFAILSCLFILSVKSSDILIHGAKLNWLKFVSKYSFHIYLTHILGLTIGLRAATIICEPSTCYFYAVKFIVAVITTILLCLFLEISQRTAEWLFLQRKYNSA